jgi:hypothetical protein
MFFGVSDEPAGAAGQIVSGKFDASVEFFPGATAMPWQCSTRGAQYREESPKKLASTLHFREACLRDRRRFACWSSMTSH